MEKAANEVIYRYERKSYVEFLGYDHVRAVVSLLPWNFRPIYHKRYVNSIYLDTYDFRNYSMNVDGYSNREKFRVRWYGDFFQKIEKPVLEIKIKRSVLGRKENFVLNGFEMRPGLETHDLREIILENKLTPQLRNEIEARENNVAVRYEREYFLSADGNFRITLDKSISFENISKEKIQMPLKPNERYCILELKYDEEHDEEAREIFTKLPFRLTRNSKYVSAVEKYLN